MESWGVVGFCNAEIEGGVDFFWCYCFDDDDDVSCLQNAAGYLCEGEIAGDYNDDDG